MTVPPGFTAYRSEGSGVVGYHIADQHIDIAFVSGAIYRYSADSAGHRNLGEMKRLAKVQRGLATFISRVVRHQFERQLV